MQGYQIGRAGLEPSAGARHRINVTVKIQRNPLLHLISMIRYIFYRDLKILFFHYSRSFDFQIKMRFLKMYNNQKILKTTKKS